MTRQTLSHLLQDWSQQNVDQPACYYPDFSQPDVQTNPAFIPLLKRDASQMMLEIGAGLWSLGMRKADRVAIMSETRYEWMVIDSGAVWLGFAVVAIYPTNTAEQTAFILQNSGSKVAVLEDHTHWEKVAPALAELPELEYVIFIDNDTVPLTDTCLTLDQLRARGRQQLADAPNLPTEAVDAVQPADLASLVYTSGTTGLPKGVALTHANLHSIAQILTNISPMKPGDTGVQYLPLSHIIARVNSYYGKMHGLISYYAPAITALVPTCQVAHPRSVSGVPRVYEKIHARIMAGMAQRSAAEQEGFQQALAVGIKRARLLNARQPIPDELAQTYAQLDEKVFKPLRTSIFGHNIEWGYSGSAPISVELMEFFHAIGIPILEGYGLTETSSPITLNQPSDYRIGTVGRALPDCDVKIAEDGEILLKGPQVFRGYYANDAATSDAFTDDGWFRSGDIGELDDDGFLRITDRKKNIIITAGGKNIAPAPIEHKLIQHPLIGQVMVHGDRRKYLVALLTLDPENAAVWAEQQGKTGLTMAALAVDADVIATIDDFVSQVNETLARFETIKYVHIVPEEFSIGNGLLTPSMKLKRRMVEERFNVELDGMYR